MSRKIEALETMPEPVSRVLLFDAVKGQFYGSGMTMPEPETDIVCGACKSVLMEGWSIIAVKTILPSKDPVVLRCAKPKCRAYNILPVTLVDPSGSVHPAHEVIASPLAGSGSYRED